ncbi:MAG: caspase family protein [Rhodoferax sp.]|nr:caspase family protein [Rhodoferax sp.]
MNKPIATHLANMLLVPLLALSLVSMAFGQTAPRRIALLVGIGDYSDAKLNLEGPPHDVAAMKDVLVRRWGFQAQDVKTLVDRQATRDNILAELAALSKRSSANDEVLVYFSGHGTSALDSGYGATIPLPHGSGAFVPVDFATKTNPGVGDLIVGRTDLVPVFSALEAGGRHLWVISDSCYSGQQVRSSGLIQPDELPSRMIPLMVKTEDAQAQRADLALAGKADRPEPYPYKATAFLAASGEGERAKDIPKYSLKKMGTTDDKPHGAMTDALLRVLKGEIPGDLDGDGVMTLNEVHRATSDFMAQRAYGHTPIRLPAVAEDAQGLGNRAVLNVRNVAMVATRQDIKPLRVRADSASSAVMSAISGIPDLRMVKSGEDTDIVLKLGKDGNRIGLLAASGDFLAGIPAAETGRIVAQVRQLAWAQRLRGLAEKHRRGALEVGIDPEVRSGNFTPGQRISFVARPDKNATLVLLNINADGKVAVLYPQVSAEDKPLPAGQASHIPGTADHQRILVQEPFGMDMQFVFAFDQPPSGLDGLHHLENADPSDPRLAAFERSIGSMSGKFTFASTELRTLKP